MTSSLGNIDLNLLVALDALLTERSVSGAGDRVGLSQPTMSGALARLRRHFGDELLVRRGNAYELSSLAVDLKPLVALALSSADRVFARSSEFDATTSTREFTLVSSDYGSATLVPSIIESMARSAQGTRLRVLPPTSEFVNTPHEALRGVDGILMPRGVFSGLPHVDLVSDEWVCIISRSHDVTDDLTMDDLAQRPWVSTTNRLPIGPMKALQLLGFTPNVQVTVESFLMVPSLVIGTERVAILQRALVEHSLHRPDLAVYQAPFRVPPLVQALWWHPGHNGDAGHEWWRLRIAEAAAKVTAASERR